jgi:hypothetical protein
MSEACLVSAAFPFTRAAGLTGTRSPGAAVRSRAGLPAAFRDGVLALFAGFACVLDGTDWV